MSASEYISSFFLVVIGFAISEVLKGCAKLIRERRLIKFYWPFILVIILSMEALMFVFLWLFTEVNKPSNSGWSIVELGLVFLIVLPYALIGYLLFPAKIKEGFDMKGFLMDNGRTIIVILMTQIILVTVLMLWRGEFTSAAYQAVSLILAAFLYRHFERLHLIWLVSMFLLTNYFIFFYSPISIR